MQYRRLGRSGMKVSVLAYGTMLEHRLADATLMRQAFDGGINFIDTADAYGEKAEVETLVGRRLKELPRDEVVLATKFRWGYGAAGPNNRGTSRKHITHAIDGSLRRLDVDFIDLYQVHGYDSETPLEETLGAIGSLLTRGKILYWGVSNMSSVLVMKILKLCDSLGVPYPVSHQPEFSIVQPGLVEDHGKYVGLATLGAEFGFGLIAYSPLAGGLLTGKYLDGIPAGSRLDPAAEKLPGWKDRMLAPARAEAARKLVPIAEQAGVSMAQMALAWVIGRKQVNSAITSFSNADQLADSLAAADVELSDDCVAAVEAVREEYKAAIHHSW